MNETLINEEQLRAIWQESGIRAERNMVAQMISELDVDGVSSEDIVSVVCDLESACAHARGRVTKIEAALVALRARLSAGELLP